MKTVLFFDNRKQNARDIRRMLAVASCQCIIPADAAEFGKELREGKYDLLIYALEYHSLVRQALTGKLSDTPTILLTNSKFEDLSPLLPGIAATNIIAKNSNGSLKLRDLVNTVKKILHGDDIFGVKHYLSFGTQSEVFHIRDSADRSEYIEAIVQFCRRFHLRNTVVQAVELFCEELLMNAIYDAPRDLEGQSLYNHLSRKNRVVLKPKQAARIEFACDGEKLAISISDPFGAITWDILQKFLVHCFASDREKVQNITKDTGGAGLGLYLSFSAVNAFIVNVEPEIRSEFIGIFDVSARPKERHTRYSNLHFFSTEKKHSAS